MNVVLYLIPIAFVWGLLGLAALSREMRVLHNLRINWLRR